MTRDQQRFEALTKRRIDAVLPGPPKFAYIKHGGGRRFHAKHLDI